MYAHNLHVDILFNFDTKSYCKTTVLSVVAVIDCRLQEIVFSLLRE